jgi:transcriptional/translational regulatory protein YebC/TACO1
MFERKGLVVGARDGAQARVTLEELELELIDFGAEDISEEDGVIRVVTALTEWNKIRDFLKQNGFEIVSAGLSYIPKQKVPVDPATAEKVNAFISVIEEDDDVSEVHTNAFYE